MRKLVATAPGKAELLSFEDRKILPNEVKIKVLFATPKHGTELADFRGTTPFMDGKFDEEWRVFTALDGNEERGIVFGDLPLGNMIVGRVIEKGEKVTDYQLLDLVCTYGSIRETVIVNAVQNHRLRIVKDLALLKNVLCYDPAQFALAAVRDAKLGPGDRVAVIGLGAIGLIALQYAKKLGANFVIGIDPIGRRRDLAKKYGATLCLDPSKIDAGLEIKKATDKEGVDIIIETSGSVHALQASLKGLAYSGTLAYVAFAKPFPQGLWLGQEAHYNYAKIIFSRAASEPTPGFPRWSRKRIEDVVFEHLTNGYLDCEDIIYPVVSFDDSAAAYMRYVDTNPEEGIKLGIEFKE